MSISFLLNNRLEMVLCVERTYEKMVFIPLCLLLVYFFTSIDRSAQGQSECLIISETLLKLNLGATVYVYATMY